MSEHTIVRMLFGSHVYGTSTPESDRDYKSVFVPDGEAILLQRATKVSRNRSTGDPRGRNAPDDVDEEEFSLQGYLKLLCQGQPVALDMLFVPAQHVLEADALWSELVGQRGRFLSKSIEPFVAYCRAQADKYGIKGSRMAAARDAAETLSRLAARRPEARLGDVADAVEALVGRHPEHAEILSIRHPQADAEVRHLSVCGRKAPYTLRIDRAAGLYEALWQRYGERSRAAMHNDGVDWKALMHARRVCDQALELLATGEIRFPRENADELLRIRRGERAYPEVAAEIEAGMEALKAALETSPLPAEPDRAYAERWVTEVYRRQVMGRL